LLAQLLMFWSARWVVRAISDSPARLTHSDGGRQCRVTDGKAQLARPGEAPPPDMVDQSL